MTQAPSPKEALELLPCPFCGSGMVTQGATASKTISVWCMKCGTRGPDVPFPDFCEPVAQIQLCHERWNTRTALATLQPSGERREAIARLRRSLDQWAGCSPEAISKGSEAQMAYFVADAKHDIATLASGLVQDEAGWRDISTAPKDGTPFIGAFWSIRWADSHRKGDVVTCWWQPEFEAFISACREMSLAPGLTFENGETRQLHSPVIEPVTHWMPLDRPFIRSARNGGEG